MYIPLARLLTAGYHVPLHSIARQKYHVSMYNQFQMCFIFIAVCLAYMSFIGKSLSFIPIMMLLVVQYWNYSISMA